MGQPLRGVNLGGWLVLEPWITPGMFIGTGAVDEYSYCQAGGHTIGALTKHRNTFVTEEDFAWLASQGIEAVRLPVGYWLFGGTAPYVKCVEYVDKAFGWAQKYGLALLLDLHAAPGSQNGEMHSGRQGAVGWNTSKNKELTLAILEQLGKRYGKHPALLGISLLNEPSRHLPHSDLQVFYEQAYAILRPLCKPEAWIVFSDAFHSSRWRQAFTRANYPTMAVDYHHYQIFTWLDRLLPAAIQVWRARHMLPHTLRRMGTHHAVVVGEWSATLPAGKVTSAKVQRQYVRAQLKALQNVDAWFYWTYKTEDGGSWSLRKSVESGLLTIDSQGTR